MSSSYNPVTSSVLFNHHCYDLLDLGWNSKKLTRDNKTFRNSVTALSYSNDQIDNNRVTQLMLAIQFEFASSKDLEYFPNVEIQRFRGNLFIKLKAEELKEEPADLKQTIICLRLGKQKPIFGIIKEFKRDFVFFRLYDDQWINTRLAYDITFMPSDMSLTLGYSALERIHQLKLTEYFCDFKSDSLIERAEDLFRLELLDHDEDSLDTENCSKIINFDWINDNIQNNEEQKLSVKNIVNCTSHPFPFVVFGPPGTGKTTVLVEAIAQILEKKPSSSILVTAQSNSACNEISSRLISLLSNSLHKMIRLLKQKNTEIPSDVEPIADFMQKIRHRIDPMKKLEKDHVNAQIQSIFNEKKVIIATLVTCVQIDRYKIKFDYIFIDECGSASEPEALIPIMTYAFNLSSIKSNVILFGDHKQLGPVINSKIAEKLGLGVSLMERIMSKPRYQANPSFNTDYVVQLRDNYRSHPAILDFSNKQFYNSLLRPMMSEKDQQWAKGWSFLSNKFFPILFHTSNDSSEIDNNGSSFNTAEATIVKTYITNLLKHRMNGRQIEAEDIGVVTPYTAQKRELKRILNKKSVEVGSTENFQGREKKIMIMSTVRSHSNSIGFLNNPKRLNVMLTRAKHLLIIIGNPTTLEMDPLWQALIEREREREY